MNINTRDLGFVNYNGQEMDFVKYNGITIYEAWKKLLVKEIPPLNLLECKGANLLNYKIFGNSVSKTRLPQEYQEVEYIQTTGTQHIDSGVPLKSGLKIIVDWVYQDADSGNNYTGGHIGSPGNRWLIGSQRNNNYYFAVGATNVSTEFRFGNRDTVEAYWANKASYFIANGVKSTTIKGENYALTEEPNYTFYISAVDRDGNATLKPKLTIYSWKFYQDDVLVRDYVPCYRKSDGEIGLYDLVTNEFYTNDGTGEFLKGNAVFAETLSVGDKTNNLLNMNDVEMESTTFRYSVKNQIVTRTCTGVVQTSWILQSGIFPEVIGTQVLEPGTYIWGIEVLEGIGLTTTSSSTTPYMQLQKSDGTTIDWSCNTPITLTEKVTISAIRSALINYAFNDIQKFRIRINEGTELKEHQPYGYKTTVKSTPNIYNYEDFFGLAGTAQSIVVSKIDFDSINIYKRYQNIFIIPNTLFKPNTTYEISKTLKVISGTSAYNTSRIAIATSQTSGAFYLIEGNKSTATFTTPEDLTDYIYLWIYGIADGEIEINDICIREIGLEPTTANIYTKQPLRKNEDYIDYTDYKEQKIFRNVMNTTFDGTENWEIHTSITGGNVFRLDNVLNPLINAPLTSTYMSHFALTDIYSTAKFNIGVYRFSSNQECTKITGTRLYISSPHTTLEEFKQWLSENRPMISYPIETMEEEVSLPSILMQRGTNIIGIDTEIQPAEVEVFYLGKNHNKLTAEQIEAIEDMSSSIVNGELTIEYDEKILPIDFYLENGELIAESDIDSIDFRINENGEMEVDY